VRRSRMRLLILAAVIIAVAAGIVWMMTRQPYEKGRPSRNETAQESVQPARDNAGHLDTVVASSINRSDSASKYADGVRLVLEDSLPDQVKLVAQRGKFDLSIVQAIRRLPKCDQPPLATELAAASHPAMRSQALLSERSRSRNAANCLRPSATHSRLTALELLPGAAGNTRRA